MILDSFDEGFIEGEFLVFVVERGGEGFEESGLAVFMGFVMVVVLGLGFGHIWMGFFVIIIFIDGWVWWQFVLLIKRLFEWFGVDN